MARKVMITVAVSGSRPTKEMNPAVPYTPSEIIDAALESYRAGAAIVHVHVRDPKTGVPVYRADLYKEVLEGIRRKCDMIVNLTTSGLFLAGEKEEEGIARRLQPVLLKPELCSFDLGSMNFHDRVFVNPPNWAEAATRSMRENGVKPEIEVFDVGHIYQALDLIKRGLIDPPPYFQLCMGVRWGMEATPENLVFMKSKLPSGVLWSALGVARAQLPMITMAILMGGNVRVGFEDNLFLKQGVLAASNAQLVEMAKDMVERLGYEAANPGEARRILGLKE
jgi:3-keto-5-aminohexanoate cleavage enzyme